MAGWSERRDLLLRPLRVWLALIALGAASLAYALAPALPFKPVFALVIVTVQVGLVMLGLMRIGKASALVRTSALAAIVWLGFLFLMAFADLWTR